MKHEDALERLREICRQYDLELEDEKISEIKRAHDRIVSLILNTDFQEVDIEIEKAKFRRLIQGLFPAKAHIYELIYEPRFRRLWEQFRE